MYKELIGKIDKTSMPKHIAIIMDGNGRWADLQKVKRVNGHKMGVKIVREIVETAVEVGLEYLTIYAFSTENWRRSNHEVKYLLKLIMNSLVSEIDDLTANNVNIRFIGSAEELGKSYNKKVVDVCKKSWHNDGLHLNVAMNYGGRREIIDAVNNILTDFQNGKIDAKIDAEKFEDYLYTVNIPDPDLVIRTSGEERLSNFLTWQSAYAELWFTKTLWPDFSRAEFIEAILDFQKRKRRFGAR
ncbi:MAG: isoprenyl transferase [Candidatus Cloacimonetes bacterium]|jgi:undecaprenyl diphosphate synthase|nr:isoprenyl transferase [Candidatus Cloacimonadota bacterium]MBT7470357.1 isoprenyl transferase [Candidatus Cloacimonadota bacterium]